MDTVSPRSAPDLLKLTGVGKVFRGASDVHAAVDIDLTVRAGQSLAIVGESGSGKSSLLRMALGLLTPDQGTVTFLGHDWATLSQRRRRAQRANIGVVFQEPFESLNPRQRVEEVVAEPLRLHEPGLRRAERRERVAAALAEVGLGEAMLRRLPRELSGGQQQRVGIARAVVRRPALILLDEPTSALDVSVQAQILQILARLHRELHCALVTVTHDLEVAANVAEQIVVMRHGRIVERGATTELLRAPKHPYTAELVAAGMSGLDALATPP